MNLPPAPAAGAAAPAGRGRRGFTLVEILLAVMLVGLLLTALTTFIFSMSELWGHGTEERLLRQHARMTSAFVERALRESGWVAPGAAGRAQRTGWVQAADSFRGRLLTAEVDTAPPLLPWPGPPLPYVQLQFEFRPGRGLYVLWSSRLETETLGRRPQREALLSRFATALAYDYYDAQFRRWTSQSQPRLQAGGTPVMPQRIRLTFQHGRHREETVVLVPRPPPEGAWVF